MAKKPYFAALLSTIVPGLGQIYAGKGKRGAVILVSTIIVGNLNAIWLSLHGQTASITGHFWAVGLPRILHDLFAFYGIVFLIWQIVDAYQMGKKKSST